MRNQQNSERGHNIYFENIIEKYYLGPNCGCSGQTGAGGGEENCIDDGRVCGGQGDCVCGECQCDSSDMGLISGPYCECMDWTCPKVRTDQITIYLSLG